jgi:AsmA protein
MRILAILSGGLVAFALALGGAVWLLLQPGFAVDQARQLIAERSGHRLAVGSSHVRLLPEPTIVLENVTLSEPGSGASPLLTAREMTLSASLGAMLTRELSAETVAIEGASISLAIDASGMPNWRMAEGESVVLPDLALARATISFVDQRSGLALSLGGFTGTVTSTAEGGLAIEGVHVANGRSGALGLSLASLKRLAADGSPISFSFTDNAMKFSFDGRLALAKAVGLAGQATLEWAERLSVTGPFETLGPTASFRQARLESFAGGGTGDLTVGFARTPRIEAKFALDGLDLAAFLPPLAFDGSWSERPLGLARLTRADIAASLDVTDLRVGSLAFGRAALTVQASDARLHIAAPDAKLLNGMASASLSIDGSREPPELAFSLAAEKLSLPHGGGDISSASITLTSAGHSQAELAGRLNGSASLILANGAWNLPSLADLLTSAGSGIVSDWRPAAAEAARLDEIAVTFVVADGIATTKDLRIAAPGISIAGSGEIDVLRHAVDFKAEALGVDGKPAFPVPLIFQGPWRAPRLYPDMPGILEDPPAAYRALSKLKLAVESRP